MEQETMKVQNRYLIEDEYRCEGPIQEAGLHSLPLSHIGRHTFSRWLLFQLVL